MVTEFKQISTLYSKPIMSSGNAMTCSTLETFNPLSVNLNSFSKTLKNSLKGDKKVEVRWLESESDLYLKQWQRRYRQLEGIDGSCKEQNYQVEQYDDWCHTARSILDLDVQYMSSKDYNKFTIETSFDILLNEDSTLEDDLDDDDVNFDDIMPIQTITIDPNDQEIIAALKSNNLAIKNGKLEFCYKKGKNTEKEKCTSEKQTKKTPKCPTLTTDVGHLNADDSTSSFPSSDSSPIKYCKSPRKSTIGNKPLRTRSSSSRRQMYICEFPGCAYQSDRNFNFLRHKRTHGKPRHDDIKVRFNSPLCTPTEHLIFASAKTSTHNDSFSGLELNSSNNVLHLNSEAALTGELNLNNLVQCNSINLADNDQSYSLANDDNLDNFSNLCLEQAFMS